MLHEDMTRIMNENLWLGSTHQWEYADNSREYCQDRLDLWNEVDKDQYHARSVFHKIPVGCYVSYDYDNMYFVNYYKEATGITVSAGYALACLIHALRSKGKKIKAGRKKTYDYRYPYRYQTIQLPIGITDDYWKEQHA